MNIEEQLKKLPDSPGVYLMKDKQGKIIYVGKSKSLKNRVRSYFRGFQSHTTKVQTLVLNIAEFEYIITDTEMEALILEATLIKKHKPRFNILLRDDKTYPYIKVTVQENFPRVIKTRQVLKDGARYFGPYSDVDAVNKTIDIINRIYPIRKCNRNLERSSERPCLNFHIGHCLGPCKGKIHQDLYRKAVEDILRFLSGKHEPLLVEIEEKMKEAAAALNFEKAAMYRNQIDAIRRLQVKQKVVTSEDVNQDMIAWAREEERTCIMVFFVRGGKLTGRDEFIIENTKSEGIDHILSQFLVQHYSGTAFVPKTILISDMPENKDLIERWLTQKSKVRVRLIVPQKGEKKKAVDLVKKNAEDYIDSFRGKIEKNKKKELEIENALSQAFPDIEGIRRIEAYDISNIYGVLSVGSMVVFEDGKKKNKDYRRFKIKTVEGPNDYGSMMEILFRRFRRGLEELELLKKTGVDKGRFSTFPDLILVDGGKGHVGSVLQVLNALDLHIPVAGMVKDDRHKTHSLYYNGGTISLKKTPTLYRYVATIQEEVHRFAIEYHRTLRSQEMTHSILDEISGVGPKRRKMLITHFKSIENLREATEEEILNVEGITKTVAKEVFLFFQKEKKNSGQ